MQCFPEKWKTAKMILIPKPGEDHHLVSSYRLINLLYRVSFFFFEKVIVKRLNLETQNMNLVLNCKFGFRQQHSTIQ